MVVVIVTLVHHYGRVRRRYRNLYGPMVVAVPIKVLKPSNLRLRLQVGRPPRQMPLRLFYVRVVVVMRLLHPPATFPSVTNAELCPLLGVVLFRLLPHIPERKVGRLQNRQPAHLVLVRVLHLLVVPHFLGP